jgi:hypothetical protein
VSLAAKGLNRAEASTNHRIQTGSRYWLLPLLPDCSIAILREDFASIPSTGSRAVNVLASGGVYLRRPDRRHKAGGSPEQYPRGNQ